MMNFAYFSFKTASSQNNPGCAFTNTDLRSPSNLCIRRSPVITPAVFRAPSLPCLTMLAGEPPRAHY